jgi:ketosteroid isomerase-like protein
MPQTKDATDAKEIVTEYFKRLYASGWEALIGDDMVFTSPAGVARGKAAYVDGTNRFKQVAKSVEVIQLIVEGDNACAVTRYRLQSPKGNVSSCDTMEVFSVRDGKIQSSRICFDTAAFGKFMAQG